MRNNKERESRACIMNEGESTWFEVMRGSKVIIVGAET